MKNLLLILFLSPLFLHAQHLMVQGTGGNLYLDHSTAAKENYYSIGRMYNISPKEIAPYNNLVLEKGLALNQKIKIPLKNNFTQTGEAAAGEVPVPVYHKAAPKETLSQISAHYKVPVASLRTWNNLKTDALAPGEDIVIGYLMVKSDLSPLAAGRTAIKNAEPPVFEAPPAPQVINKKVTPAKPVTPVKETPMMKADPPATEKTLAAEPAKPSPARDFKGGSFKSVYEDSGKNASGTAGIFKSTSGWEDGKYYCLYNAAPRGTVVKITNPATGKAVFAKVLDLMPDLKQNADVVIRLSNAAADALGAGAESFACTINY